MTNINQFPSVSRIPIKILKDEQEILDAQLIRHFSPLTISQLIKQLPIIGSIYYNNDNFCYLKTQLTIGAEKQKKAFSIGDITLMTSTGSICFILKETSVSYTMNHIGKISTLSNIEFLKNLKSTNIITIKQYVQNN